MLSPAVILAALLAAPPARAQLGIDWQRVQDGGRLYPGRGLGYHPHAFLGLQEGLQTGADNVVIIHEQQGYVTHAVRPWESPLLMGR